MKIQFRYLAKYFTIFVIFILSLVLEASAFRFIPPSSIIPALYLIIIYYLSLKYRDNFILFLFFIYGVIRDVLFSAPVGLTSILILIYSGYVALNKASLVNQSFIKVFLYFIISVLVFNLLKYIIIALLFGVHGNYMELLFHMITTIILYPLLYNILKKLRI